MNNRLLTVIMLAAAALAGCSATPTFQTGEDAEVTFDGLTRMEGTVMDIVWARTDIDLTAYSKIKLEGLGVEYRDVDGPYSGRAGTSSMRTRSDVTEFQLDAETRATFEEEIGSAFQAELARSNVFEIVTEAGPDVLLIRGGLLDVVSRVPPDPMGNTQIFIDSVGEATLILEIRGSLSNTIYVRAVDGRAASSTFQMQLSNRATNRAEIRRLGRHWGQLLRQALDTLLTDGLQQ